MSYLALRHCNEKGHKYLYDTMKEAIDKNHPLMIGKIGAIELQIIVQTMMIANKMLNDYNPVIRYEAINTAGMHPPNNTTFNLFSQVFLDTIKDINILASWNDNLLQFEENIWKQFINRPPQLLQNQQHEVKGIVDLMSLESFYTTPDKWWQNLYKGKTILIISPFVKSISKQLEYPQRDKVWFGKWNNFWDKSINFKYIKFQHPYPTLSKEEQEKYPKTFLEVIRNFEREIDNIGEFDIALVGTGCYSIPLCSYIKCKKRKSAFHLGGGLQMMFGVYGNRWFQNGNPSQFFKEYINEHWIRPSGDEVPQGYKQQENGAYF
jgi:hypothetical protein